MAYRKPKSADRPSGLFILNGELRGVSVPLGEGEIRLGTPSDCDVVLLSERGDESEVVISSNDDVSYIFEAMAGTVRVGTRKLKPGTPKAISGDARVTVGDVEMALASSFEEAKLTKRNSRAPGMIWAASIALGIGALGFLAFTGGPGSVVAKPSPSIDRTYVIDQSGRTQAMVAAKKLIERLDQVGLEGLEITGDQSERMVSVSGKIRNSDRTRWLETVEWFDESFGNSVYLDAKLIRTEDQITLPFSIQMVWAGQTPRVTLHDGTKRTVGDELPGGWVLEAIFQQSVRISRGGETLDVAL